MGARKSAMSRQAKLIGSALLALYAMLGCGCGSYNSMAVQSPAPAMGRQTGSTPPARAAERAMRVATTSACAQAFGHPHDPVKLRMAYLDFETKQGATRAQMVDIEKSYDGAVAEARGRQDSFCSGRDSEEIRTVLRRYQAGYFADKAAAPKSS